MTGFPRLPRLAGFGFGLRACVWPQHLLPGLCSGCSAAAVGKVFDRVLDFMVI